VLLDRGLCDGSITRPERSPTECDVHVCVCDLEISTKGRPRSIGDVVP
jgi:hypothetical protein